MNGSAQEVESQESDQPKNQESDYDIPKHKICFVREGLADGGESLPNLPATAIPVGKAPISATVSLL